MKSKKKNWKQHIGELSVQQVHVERAVLIMTRDKRSQTTSQSHLNYHWDGVLDQELQVLQSHSAGNGEVLGQRVIQLSLPGRVAQQHALQE